MDPALRRGVALGGFMGVGKTSVGLRLAQRLGLPFVDMDAELIERFGPIQDQFARDGEEAFRVRESALVGELCDGVLRVVATGGGVWSSAGNRARLHHAYWTVVMDAPVGELRRRLGSGEGRPLWADAEALLEQRRKAYRDAHLILGTEGFEIEEVVDQIVEWLQTRTGGEA
jgi:shikimate kinase